jgi:hypothetical protein
LFSHFSEFLVYLRLVNVGYAPEEAALWLKKIHNDNTMKKLFPLLALLLLSTAANAQRVTDVVDRGLVAVSVSDGVFLSWRIFGEESYDVDYNLYRDGVTCPAGSYAEGKINEMNLAATAPAETTPAA